jgi:GNAT superfamily N-acetyltransferase
VYIDEVIVEPSHRGKGVGSELFRRMSESIDLENCVIGLKAFPILEQPGANRSPEEIARVKQFYTRLGFHPVGEDFMIKDASLCGSKKKRTALRNRQGADG